MRQANWNKILFFDSEFNRTVMPRVNPVCATTILWDVAANTFERKDWWVHNREADKKKLLEYFEANKDCVFSGYQCVAEARFMQSIGANVLDYFWVDLFLEYRCLTNHNDELAYGMQLVDGKPRLTKRPPPKWERAEDDSKSFKPTHSLAEASYKLLGVIRDTEHKNQMRDLIISDPDGFDAQDMASIMVYCAEDTKHLPKMFKAIVDQYKKLGISYDKDLRQEMLLRGKYSALTALMESRGYPVNVKKMKNFTNSVGPLLEECQREINALFPDIRPFYYNRKERRFSMNQKNITEWLKKNVDIKSWMKSDGYKDAKRDFKKTGKWEYRGSERTYEPKDEEFLSLSLDAFQKRFPFQHNYPKDSFGAQMVRFLKLKQSMNGFLPGGKSGSIWDKTGEDGRVRPFFNPYGAQSSRSQPPATSYLFLKPAWTRSLCEPGPGRCVGSFDYKSEEFLVSALVSQSEEMIDSYKSGDVYLAFGKKVGMIPPNGTKKTHKRERDLCKSLILGISYLMSAKGLAEKLTEDTGRVYTEEQAQEYINDFYSVYWELKQFQDWIQNDYAANGNLKLPCGWYMFGDNDNHRSVCNVPIQGVSASIMRKAVEYAEECGLEVVVTLHDALYIEFDYGDWGAMDKLADCMKRAFLFYFEDKESASLIELDGYIWGPDCRDDAKIKTPGGLEIDTGKLYIDSRAEEEYNQFSKYFEDRAENYL
jgi:hypothetical protein